MDKDLGKRTPKERYNDNVAAIRLLFSLEKQGRNALFESMSCGCLLVSSDTEPVREVVRHGENGFLCDFWDHDMLADMTTELLARSDAMGPVRAAARQSIVEEYNLKVQIPRHMDLLLSTYADWKKARQTS